MLPRIVLSLVALAVMVIFVQTQHATKTATASLESRKLSESVGGNETASVPRVVPRAFVAGSNHSAEPSVEPQASMPDEVSMENFAMGQCLCLFDIDRTLTGKQSAEGCSGDLVMAGIVDHAYGGGTLKLSELGQHMDSTPCNMCSLGAISANGGLSGAMTAQVNSLLRGGPMVFGCRPSRKPVCAKRIAESRGIALSDVFFFDDQARNILAFEGSGMNAHQVSCASRDSDLGLCGGQVGEVQLASGVTTCR